MHSYIKRRNLTYLNLSCNYPCYINYLSLKNYSIPQNTIGIVSLLGTLILILSWHIFEPMHFTFYQWTSPSNLGLHHLLSDIIIYLCTSPFTLGHHHNLSLDITIFLWTSCKLSDITIYSQTSLYFFGSNNLSLDTIICSRT